MRHSSASEPLVNLPPRELNLAVVHRLYDRRIRDRERLFLAEGVRFLHKAEEQDWPIAGLGICPRLLAGESANALVRRLTGRGAPRRNVSTDEFRQLTRLPTDEQPQGVLVIAHQRWDLLPQSVASGEIWLGLESIRSPGNLGSLMRTAAAVGATRVVVFDRSVEGSENGLDPFDPLAVRASMGGLFALRFTRTTHREFRQWNRETGMWAIGADAAAEVDYRYADYSNATIVMLGDERKGLSPGQRATCQSLVRIPMAPGLDSLNVAVSGGLILYEAARNKHCGAGVLQDARATNQTYRRAPAVFAKRPGARGPPRCGPAADPDPLPELWNRGRLPRGGPDRRRPGVATGFGSS